MDRGRKGQQVAKRRKQDLYDEEDNLLQEPLDLIEKLF